MEGIFFAILPAIGFTVLGSLVVGTIFVGPRRGMERPEWVRGNGSGEVIREC